MHHLVHHGLLKNVFLMKLKNSCGAAHGAPQVSQKN
jgi:hypothetical protein